MSQKCNIVRCWFGNSDNRRRYTVGALLYRLKTDPDIIELTDTIWVDCDDGSIQAIQPDELRENINRVTQIYQDTIAIKEAMENKKEWFNQRVLKVLALCFKLEHYHVRLTEGAKPPVKVDTQELFEKLSDGYMGLPLSSIIEVPDGTFYFGDTINTTYHTITAQSIDKIIAKFEAKLSSQRK